jgi:molecular chaperone HscA
LDEFLALESVQDFGATLRNTMMDILRSVDKSWLKSAPFGAIGVVLSGGGATLPMVQDLAQGVISVQGVELKLVKTKDFPEWMAEHDEYVQFEEVYPRIAVSLGGARKQVIEAAGKYQITAGDVVGHPVLGGYYTKGL